MYQGLILFYVGAVLMLNGLWMQGRIADREIPVINLFVGCLSLAVALKLAFGADTQTMSIRTAAFTMLFSLTYLWVAFNRLNGCDGRGLGWFSLFVAITVLPVAGETLAVAESGWGYWQALSWLAWGGLWFLFFLQLACGKDVTRITAVISIVQGIMTGWLPGYLLLVGQLS